MVHPITPPNFHPLMVHPITPPNFQPPMVWPVFQNMMVPMVQPMFTQR
jgi:hypothetical protein